MDLIELTEAFLTAKYHAFSPNTRRAYRSDLMACARLFPRTPLPEITVAHLRLFLDATADLAPTTLARRKAALRSCFGWAYQQELLSADPTARLEAITIGEADSSKGVTSLRGPWVSTRTILLLPVPGRGIDPSR